MDCDVENDEDIAIRDVVEDADYLIAHFGGVEAVGGAGLARPGPAMGGFHADLEALGL